MDQFNDSGSKLQALVFRACSWEPERMLLETQQNTWRASSMRIEEIKQIINRVKSVPVSHIERRLLCAVQCSNEDIKNILFNTAPTIYPINYNKQQAQILLREFATKYVTFTISLSTARKFNTTVRNISYATIQQWFSANGSQLGLWMIMDHLLYDQGLAPILTSTNESLSTIIHYGQDMTFITGFLLECEIAGSFIPAKIFLNLINALDPSEKYLQSVLSSWQRQARWPMIQDFNSVDWFETVAPVFAQDTNAFNAVKTAVDKAISVKTGPHKYDELECSTTFDFPISICMRIPSLRYEYGEALLRWLNQTNGPGQYQMRSEFAPDNFEN